MVENLHLQTRHEPLARQESGARQDSGVSALHRRPANEVFGDSQVMQQLQRQIDAAAAGEANVLIAGERGTGRRLVARTIHSLGRNASAPLISVTCVDGVEGVLDAIATLEMVTAARSTSGQGTRGTLVLDGVTDLSPNAQFEIAGKLGMIRREANGHAGTHPRVIATLEGTPQEAIRIGLLHAEVARALAKFQITTPTLRERGEDIESLAQYFLALLNSEHETAKSFSGDSLKLLRQHAWPGNVHELRSAVQRAYLKAEQVLDIGSVLGPSAETNDPTTLRIVVGTSLADAERRMIAATLTKCNGNKTRAAALLGVSLKTLYNRLNAYRAEEVDLGSGDRDVTEATS